MHCGARRRKREADIVQPRVCSGLPNHALDRIADRRRRFAAHLQEEHAEVDQSRVILLLDAPYQGLESSALQDRKSVVEGKSVDIRVELWGRRIIKKNKRKNSA